MEIRIATVFVLSALFTIVVAQEEQQPNEPAMVPPTNLTPPPRADPMTPLMVQRLQAMQTHWEKMRQTEDPATRLRLMQEHRETMGETATMLRGIMHAQGMLPLLERLEAMQADMDRILATEDTQLRGKLMDEHLEKMRETNAMLHSVMGDGGRLAIKGGAGLGPLGGMGGGHNRHHAMMSPKGSMHPMAGGRHGRASAPESLRQMRRDLDEILQIQDPAERQERLLALSTTLDAAIAPTTGKQTHGGAKHGMSGGQHKMHGKMHGKGPHHGDGGFHERVEKRLELIQSLVEQLLEYHIRD